MLNTSTILWKLSLLCSLLENNFNLVVSVAFAIILVLWCLTNLKNGLNRRKRRLRRQQQQNLALATKAKGEVAAENAAEPSTPLVMEAIARLDAMQSFESPQRKSSLSAAATVTTLDEIISTPRLCEKFQCLNLG